MRRLITLLFVTLAATACASQSDFDGHIEEFEALRANHELLIQQLDTWADELTAWGQQTGFALYEGEHSQAEGGLHRGEFEQL